MILRLVIGVIVFYLLFRLFRKAFPRIGGKAGPAELRTAAGEDLVDLCSHRRCLPDADRREDGLFLLAKMPGTV
jgi:hypothetical protein